MTNNRSMDELSLRHRLEIIVTLLRGQPIRPVLERLSSTQLVHAHNFLWNKLIEFHYKTQRHEFRREDVTRNMIPSAKYQKLQNCDLRLDYCKGVECIWSHPVCAGNKVMNNMEMMAEHIRALMHSQSKSGTVPEPRLAVLQD